MALFELAIRKRKGFHERIEVFRLEPEGVFGRLALTGASAVVDWWPGLGMATHELPRIAWLWPGTPEGSAAAFGAYKDGMRENGLIEGKHYILDARDASGKYDQFPALADELVKRNPAINMANTIAAVRAAQKATTTIPIIFVNTNDPVGSEKIASHHISETIQHLSRYRKAG